MRHWKVLAGVCALALGASGALARVEPAYAAQGVAKNWTPPAGHTLAQTLVDATMAAHPELLSVTFHGRPPGAAPDVYTMFAGSYPDRIGNPDDPDDIDVITKGITILDPRWGRTHDAVAKFVVQAPLRDVTGRNIGLVVYAFRRSATEGLSETEYFQRAATLRDDLARRIPSFSALLAPA